MDPYRPAPPPRANFKGLEASSLYCPQCRCAQPVRSKLLLVLPTGEKYAYYCRVCGAEVGSKTEQGNPWGLG
ncbi:MAG: hypothetical protein V1797_01735 [Pseudomonadota bacterium]